MTSKQAPRSSILLITLALLVGAAAAAQEDTPKKYRLAAQVSAPGDVSVRSSRSEFAMQVQVFQPDAETPVGESPTLERKREKYTETVMAVSKLGPTQFTRRYAISTVERTAEQGAPPKVTSLPRQGKTVTFNVKGTTATVTAEKAKLPATEVAGLKREVAVAMGTPPFYPDREVAPGEEWTLEGKELAAAFGGGTAKLRAKFEEVVRFQGHPCARISVNLELDGSTSGTPITMNVTGEVHHALDLHRDLMNKMSGPVTLKRTITRGDATFEMRGQGTATFEASYVWLKVRGKPVAAKKP